MMNKKLRIIISGGGTAGHIYPALAVAEQLRTMGHEVLFVGAAGKMEMERVPDAGFRIIGLPIAGIQRKLTLANLAVPFKLIRSLYLANKVIEDFQPDVVAGFGGYASAPILKAASRQGVPTVIQEQNSYAGLTNRMLAKKAKVICTAYENMGQFFDTQKTVLTGNPLRITPAISTDRTKALDHFGLSPQKQTILITGGSLGTRSLNEATIVCLESATLAANMQIIWQTGRYYFEEFKQRAERFTQDKSQSVALVPFIDRMDLAYSIADIVVCRAGASTISELQLLGKAAIFVPSPNVAEDHQTKNAQSMVAQGAAMMVTDNLAKTELFPTAIDLLANPQAIQQMEQRIKTLGKPNAAKDVANIIISVAHKVPMTTDATDHTSKIENHTPQVYFIGIGGIGMSALARFFKHEGYAVAGYDRTETPLTLALEEEGIPVHYADEAENIPSPFRNPTTTVIYTPAIPADNAELNYFREHDFEILKRSQALGKLSQGKYLQAVAGTHGKTTTSTMAAWFNTAGAEEGSAFLGGISKNFGSNMVLGSGNRLVVEADEFDRSFLQLAPDSAVITAADPDHLDIYGTAEEFRHGFEQFISQIKPGGRVIIKKGVDLTINNSQITVLSYSLDDPSTHYHASDIKLLDGGYYQFNIVTPARTIKECTLGIPGLINIENCVAAVALIDNLPYETDRMRRAIASFSGVTRRFDFHLNTPQKVYMDDYAHHPRELSAMLSSTRNMFPNRHITIAFQPHLYTRTRDFYKEFAEALSLADHVLLIPIYPAREEPIEGITSNIIFDKITVTKEILNKEALSGRIAAMDTDILITAGAGNIDQLIPEITQIIKTKNS